jgi:xanthine dehydrogenase accessory factor
VPVEVRQLRRPNAVVDTTSAEVPREIRPLALVKGAGDLATGVALRLLGAGFSVVMTETAQPTVVRRAVAFAQAVYAGQAQVQGHVAVLSDGIPEVIRTLRCGHVAVVVDPSASIRAELAPELLVDAIMAKRNVGTSIDDARAVLGLGPGFRAGRDAHAVIETMRGADLGRVILDGEALPNTGIPAERNGFGRERVLRSPCLGVFVPVRAIGDRVQKGDVVAEVEGTAVLAEVDGVIRGLLNPGLQVGAGFKVGDVEPGGEPWESFLVSDKAFAIGDGVVEAAGLLLGSGRRPSRRRFGVDSVRGSVLFQRTTSLSMKSGGTAQ